MIHLGTAFNHLAGKKLPRGIKEAKDVHYTRDVSQADASYHEEYGDQEEGEVNYTSQYPPNRGHRGHQSASRGQRGRGNFRSRGQRQGHSQGKGRGRGYSPVKIWFDPKGICTEIIFAVLYLIKLP